MNTILMPGRELPIRGTYDVIVAGGGVAGAFAGISAAREGLRALIVEPFGSLGGSATMALVTPLMTTRILGCTGHCPLGEELSSRLMELGGAKGEGHEFDPTLMKAALEDMAAAYGCDLLYYTTLVDVLREGDALTHVILHNKDGLSAWKAACFIDATGDADLSLLAGVPCESGNEKGINQPVSLRFEMAGVDFDRFHAYMRSLGWPEERYFAMNTPCMREVLVKAHEDGLLTGQDIAYFQAFGIPGKPDVMAFNCPELTTRAGVADAAFLTEKQLEGKQAVLRLRRFLRERIPGFENAYITEIAPMVGLRESRRIHAEYTVTLQDILSYRKYPDVIARSAYHLDVHGEDDCTLGLHYAEDVPEAERYWEIPYRCMVAEGLRNLLAVGRCGGFDFRAQSAARVQLICRSMGEAAGLACAMSLKAGVPFSQVDGAEVRRRMGL